MLSGTHRDPFTSLPRSRPLHSITDSPSYCRFGLSSSYRVLASPLSGFWRFFEPPVSALVSALLRHHSTLPPHLRPRQSIANSLIYCHSDFSLVGTAIARSAAAALPFSSEFRVAGVVACISEPSPSSDAPAAFETAPFWSVSAALLAFSTPLPSPALCKGNSSSRASGIFPEPTRSFASLGSRPYAHFFHFLPRTILALYVTRVWHACEPVCTRPELCTHSD